MSFPSNHPQQRFERYVRTYQHRVYGFAVYFLGDRDEAADVTQDVLLRLWQHRDTVEEERLLGWLLRVARNACVDVLRKRKARRHLMTPEGDNVGQAAGSEPAPDACAEAVDFQQHLERALTQIAEPYRSIVILREVQELKYEEISGAMNLPLNTVKVYLHRGRKMLREQLSKVMHRETA
ncbi:MAG: RNA polymerase sigma factor [Rhodothermales bacterium]